MDRSPADQVEEICRLFRETPGWRQWDADYDPSDLLVEIAKVVGEPLNVEYDATAPAPDPDPEIA